MCIFNEKLTIFLKRPRLLLITNRKWVSNDLNKHRPWMTLKVTDNQYGWLY